MCVYICVCVYIHIYIYPQLFVSVLYFETESHFAGLAGLELNYVDQAGLELSEILLPLSLWSAGTENTSHHTQLSLRFDRLLQAICYMIIPLLKKIFFPWSEEKGILSFCFVYSSQAHYAVLQLRALWRWLLPLTSRWTDDRESVKGFYYITECFSSKSLWNGRKRVLQCEVSDVDPQPHLSRYLCTLPQVFLGRSSVFSLIQEKGKLNWQ